MKNRIFIVECKRGICSLGLSVGIVILVIVGMIGADDTVKMMQEVDYLGNYVRSIEAVYQGMDSRIFTFFIPIACTLPMSASCLEDFQSGMISYLLLKTTKGKYKWSKVINCALFGGVVVLSAIVLLFFVNYAKYPMSIEELERWRMLDFTYHVAVMGKVFILCMNGILYSILGGITAIFTKNRYMAYAAPFIFYYVVSTLASAYLTDYWMLNPEEWMRTQRVSTATNIVMLFFLITIMMVGYSKIIERRWENE